MVMADRPRRSARQPARIPVVQTKKESSDVVTVPSRPTKRKAPEPVDPQTQLRSILENPKSVLTTTDISELLNANTWEMLSDKSRKALLTLLPSTAFADHLPGASHLGKSSQDQARAASDLTEGTLNLSIFNDPHFLDAAHTFQDHLFSGWFTASHHAKLNKYHDGVQDGTLAVPWKDEVWERENPRPVIPVDQASTTSLGVATGFGTKATAGASADLKLSDLVKDKVLLVGDIISYRRNFSGLGIVVEKDTVIQSTDPLTHTLAVLVPKGTTISLPSSLTRHKPDDPGSEVMSVTISTPQMLETLVLDTDGRVKKNQRPNGNAWKSFTVSRWREGYTFDDTTDPKGGREIHGTLFYLRGSHYYER